MSADVSGISNPVLVFSKDALFTLMCIHNDDWPSSLSECFHENGEQDASKFMECLQKDYELKQAERNMFFEEDDGDYETLESSRKTRKSRSVKLLCPCCYDADGQLHLLEPRSTVWHLAYAVNVPEGKLHDKFRRRFRMPHLEFLVLLDELRNDQSFDRWKGKDASGRMASPIELLLLGSLRHLGHGLTFDDLEECTAMSEETHRVFFHQFTLCGRTALCKRHVKMLKTSDEFDTHRSEFTTGGLNGCGFSTDGTNAIMWRCSDNLKQANMGFKQSHPARSHNMTCNHRCEILHTTAGHPARWNDKTLAIFNAFLVQLHESRMLQDVHFELCALDGAVGYSGIVQVKCCGAWGLCDNGCHKWSCMQAPSKSTTFVNEKRLSDWIESFRKDSECVFGILKGQWRVRKTGIRVEGSHVADSTWMTCCSLHNWLLDLDGLSGEWEGELGLNEVDDFVNLAPFAVQRMANPEIHSFGSREHEREAELANVLRGRRAPEHSSDADSEEASNASNRPVIDNADGRTDINSLSCIEFRNRLTVHFDMLHRQHRMRWPKRNVA